MKRKTEEQQITIYTDGSGARPDGKGSGFAWYCAETGEKKITPQDHLTNNQAEYLAIISAAESLPKGAKAEIRTDSENTCCQLNGQRRVRDPKLVELHGRILGLMEKNKLNLVFKWIPRRDNLAGKLI